MRIRSRRIVGLSLTTTLVFAMAMASHRLSLPAVQSAPIAGKPLAPWNLPSPSPEPRTSPSPCPGIQDCTAWNNSEPTQIHVEFPGPDHMTLHGHLYIPGVNTVADLDALSNRPSSPIGQVSPDNPTPQGLRPSKLLYPVVIYNHGSEADPKGAPALAKLYVDKGYAFFAPDRHGQGLSKDAGDYIVDVEKVSGYGQASVDLHACYNRDVIAAVDWLKKQPWVNTQRLVMTGISYGGIQTLLTAEKDPGISLYLPFTPASESWGNPKLRDRMQAAVTDEKASMFLIQAQGDYSLGPIQTLGAILDAKGDHNKWKSKLYPKFGCSNQEAHGQFAGTCGGIAIWSHDVLKFIDEILK